MAPSPRLSLWEGREFRMTLGAGWCEQERANGSAAKEEFGEHHEPSGQGSFLHLAVKNVWGKSRFWEWFVRAGAVSGGQGCFPPGVWGQQLSAGAWWSWWHRGVDSFLC